MFIVDVSLKHASFPHLYEHKKCDVMSRTEIYHNYRITTFIINQQLADFLIYSSEFLLILKLNFFCRDITRLSSEERKTSLENDLVLSKKIKQLENIELEIENTVVETLKR